MGVQSRTEICFIINGILFNYFPFLSVYFLNLYYGDVNEKLVYNNS